MILSPTLFVGRGVGVGGMLVHFHSPTDSFKVMSLTEPDTGLAVDELQ